MHSLASLSVALLLLACSSESPTHDTESSGGAGGTGGGESSSPHTKSSSGGGGGGSTSGTGGTGGGSGGSGGNGGDSLPTRPIQGTISRYSYVLDLNTTKAKSQLEVDVAPPGGDCFSVSDRVSSTDATWNGGAPKSATLNKDVLEVCGTQGVTEGQALTIGASTSVPLKTYLTGLNVGLSHRLDQDGGQFTYLLSWVGGCDHFGPCDPDPSRLSAFHFDVTHPSDTVVLCPGTVSTDAQGTHCELSGTLAPTYSAFAVAADPLWTRKVWTSAAGLDLVFYETPSGKLAQSLDKTSAEEFIVWITDLLGPFPYGSEVRFAGGPTAWLGFEHPANILLYEQLDQLGGIYENTLMHVFIHELVHQWAGDRVTIASALDFVWKEATAEYLTYVFEDEMRPSGEASASLSYWDSICLQAEHYPRPTDMPAPSVQNFYGDVYGPGPMVLYVQLESMFGRAPILAGIQAFLADPGARTVADLEAALGQSTGQDLSAYFNAWVYGTGVPEWPTLAVSTTQTGDQVTVTATQQNASRKLYGCKVEIQVNGLTQSVVASVDFGVAPTSASAQTTVTLAEPVVTTVLDPRHRLVARQATPGIKQLKLLPKKKVWIL